MTRIVLDLKDWHPATIAAFCAQRRGKKFDMDTSSFGRWLADQLEAQVESPLIVLDLEDHGRVNAFNLADVLREDGYPHLADQIAEQTKPARIEEPGQWGVVEAAVRGGGQIRFTFIKATNDLSNQWVDIEDGSGFDWSDLIDPTLIRAGVDL